MMHEIVYTESRTSVERSFLMDVTLLAHQKSGGTCAVLLDAHTQLHEVSRRRGVEVSKVLVSAPDSLRRAREIMESLVRSGTCSLVIIEGFPGIMTPSFAAKIEELASLTETSILFAR